MAANFGPHLERLAAAAGSLTGRLVAIAGARGAGLSPGHSGEEPRPRAERSAPNETMRAASDEASSAVHVLELSRLHGVMRGAVDAAVHALCFMADDLLVAGSARGQLLAWDVTAGKSDPALRLSLPDGVRARALASDVTGKILAAACDDGSLRLYDLSVTGGTPKLEPRGARKLCGRVLRAVAIDPAGGTVAAAGDDSVIRTLPLSDVAAGAMREMPCGEGGIGAVCYSGDGRVVAGCVDGTVRVCFLEGAVDQEDRAGDAAHTAPVRGLVLGPRLLDEAGRDLPRRLLSAGEDGVLKAWQLDSRRKPRTVELGSPLHAMVWLAASSRAKPEKRGGTLALINKERQLVLVTLNERSEPAEPVVRVDSELARLRQDVSAKNQQVREAAVRALGEIAEDDARVLLDQVLGGDRQAEIRLLAAEVVGRSMRRRSRPALRRALDDNDAKVRAAALVALAGIEREAPLAPVRAALASKHADMRREAVKQLPGLRRVSPLVPSLVADALRDASADVRTQALDGLYEMEPDRLAPVRIALARGPADIRQAALVRLARSPHALEPEGGRLLEAALDDPESPVRGTAFLVAIGVRSTLATRLSAVDPVTAKALEELQKEGRLGQGSAAGELTEEDLAPLFAAMACRAAESALRGARCLALLGDSRATGALLQLSREQDVEVRRYSVEALTGAAIAMPGDDRVVARLQWLLDDEDATVRSWAMGALQKLQEPEGVVGELELAQLTLRCAHEDIRVRALQILVQFGGDGKHAGNTALTERADALLGHALDDEAQKVRAEAFRTLWAWHSKNPRLPLERGVASRHADVRVRVVGELESQEAAWASELLIQLVRDASSQVGLAAYKALTDPPERFKKRGEAQRGRKEVHLAALTSPRPEVRAAGCTGAARWASVEDVRLRLRELVKDEHPVVHIAAIEAADHLMPEDQEAFVLAWDSIFYNLRVRAAELCGKRRDRRAVEPMKALLTIPSTHISWPGEEIRGRAARALADVGDPQAIPFYVSLLDDENGNVREMGARGLATACRPGEEQPLVDAMAHADLSVRSWVAEGLARLGDDRAVPVLAGTLKHEHRPIRVGAILSFVALGPDGVRGMLQGLEDPDRTVQDLVFAIIAARDVALARAGLPPDLLLSALSSVHPEIRFVAARVLEARIAGEDLLPVVQELVGPRRPERASEMKDWPAEDERRALLNVLINALASDHPAQRYAAAQVLALSPQPLGFWREARRLSGPSVAGRLAVPHTNWEDEARQPRKKDWIRRLFGRGPSRSTDSASTDRVLTVIKFAGSPEPRPVPPAGGGLSPQEVQRLVFGSYAGLIRQAPPAGEADETHRVRRDSLERLAALARCAEVGRDAVMPVLRRAISDPHHLVRKAAVAALTSLYPEGSKEPLRLALQSSAADVGRVVVEGLIAAATADPPDAEAADLARSALEAPNAEVRAFALAQLPKLFDEGSVEPWLLALGGKYPDVRSTVVHRLLQMQAKDPRVDEALGRAMESDHEDLRLKAAVALARRGDPRTVDVLAALLRSEERLVLTSALESLVTLARNREAAAAAAEVVARRLEDDPDKTAPRSALIDALAGIGDPAAESTLLGLFTDEDAAVRRQALGALVAIAVDRGAGARLYPDGTRRQSYDEPLALRYLSEAVAAQDVQLRQQAVQVLRDLDHRGAEELLARLVGDREPAVRVEACEAQAFRAKYVESATVDPLVDALRSGRRELVLPAAAGMALRRRPEAFQALMLVFKAGENVERERASVALGLLGDRRALEELEPLVDPRAEIPEEDRYLAPAAAMALGCMLPHLKQPEEQQRVRETVERLALQGSPAVRQQALVGLCQAGDDRSRSVLERVAGDRHDEVAARRKAVEELGLLGNPAAEMPLAEVLEDPDFSLRRAALDALSRLFPTERTRVSLLALRSRFHDMSGPAAGFLARHGDATTLVARLAEVKERSVRRRLRRGLVRRKACPVPALVQLLTAEQTEARAEAAWIAGSSGDVQLAAAVRQAVRHSARDYTEVRRGCGGRPDDVAQERLAEHQEAWRAGLWAATRLGAEASEEALLAIRDAEAPPPVRREALRYLGRHGAASDLAAIQPSLSDPDAGVRVAAGAAVARLAPERATEVIEALSVADGAALVPVVQASFSTGAGRLMRSEAGRRVALPVVLGKRLVEELSAVALASGKDPVRLVAIAALGRMGGEAAAAVLKQLLQQEQDDVVRGAVYRALRRLQRLSGAATRYADGQDKGGGGSGGGGGWDDDEDDDGDDYDDDDDDDDGDDDEEEDDDEDGDDDDGDDDEDGDDEDWEDE